MSDWLRDSVATAPTVQKLLQSAKSVQGLIQPKVLKAFQLDGQALEKEAASLLTSTLSTALGYIGNSLPYRYEEEIELAITLTLFKMGFWNSNQFYGDKLQNVVYRSEWKAQKLGLENILLAQPETRPSITQKVLKGLLGIVLPYLMAKLNRRAMDEDWSTQPRESWKYKCAVLLKWWDHCTAFCEFFNFLAFLRYGTYRSLTDRALGLRLVHGRQRMARVVNLIFLTQQIFYNNLFSVLTYLLPLMNLGRLWGYIKGFRGGSGSGAAGSGSGGSPTAGPGGFPDRCVLCGVEPIALPRRSIPCHHVICYYCAASRTANGGTFPCPYCGHTLTGDDFTLPQTVSLRDRERTPAGDAAAAAALARAGRSR